MKIGLALSGGGLRGIFHLGVLEALEELGIPIYAFSGSSAGAIVCVLYASGHTPGQILNVANESSLFKLLKLNPWSGGLLSHKHLEGLLAKHLSVRHLEDLDRPVFIAATNIRTGRVEIFSKGEIIPIVTASSAIPIMFNPIEYQGEYYLDGGLMMNMPVSPLGKICDKVIAVNLVPEIELPRGQLNHFLKVAQRTFDLALLNNVRPELDLASIIISMDDLNKVSRMSWGNLKEVYSMGYEATMFQREKLNALL